MGGAEATVRLLTYTNLYPNAEQPTHGLFVERRLLRIIGERGLKATAVAPVPWVPPPIRFLRRYRSAPKVAREERRAGVRVLHPRFVSIPGLGLYLAPFAMVLSSLLLVRRLNRTEGIDIIDAHYFYPDGVAAAFLAWLFDKPLVITARGTDVNLLPTFRFARTLIRWAARVADRIITVSEALRLKLIDLGVSPDKITTLRNGVDTNEFVSGDQSDARRVKALPGGLILLSVGNLIEAKGHHLVIEALLDLPEAYLVIAGSGERREHLEQLATRLGVLSRVRFTGALAPAELVGYYNASDVLVLASEREGMPNVILEGLSCGLPVVAMDCGGVAEVVDRPEFGRLLAQRTPGEIARTVRDLWAHYPDRDATRQAARAFEWGPTIQKQAALYRDLATGAAA
jgi:teichuronic acid biosynthesis glycosyltransferase TuaC